MNCKGDPVDIRGWQRLSDRVTTSGKLGPADPARLASAGVRHVVNLALDEHPEALADEGALLAAEGIAYTHIPIPFDAPDKAHYAAFKAALADGEGPVHVHCIMNWRVSAFFYLLHREHGMPDNQARALMTQQWDPCPQTILAPRRGGNCWRASTSRPERRSSTPAAHCSGLR